MMWFHVDLCCYCRSWCDSVLTSAVVVGHAYKFRSGSMAVALEWCSHLDVASKAEIGKVRTTCVSFSITPTYTCYQLDVVGAVAQSLDHKTVEMTQVWVLYGRVKPWASSSTLYCSSSVSCVDEYLAIYIGVYLCINCFIHWLQHG